ncbi:SCF ubiquitin ligase complex subunit [Friedmanniomyces endolithicus]|uniref:SCF ubiquitin ligase complex subunit n=1 Tax=Friedmanniomyces endolithicus TaxID=329885 RepID=A0AAN6H7D3_9PEZI|nr:SCF ubiquitin ligase complex subunit [Friedmanniomyces endolithicus]
MSRSRRLQRMSSDSSSSSSSTSPERDVDDDNDSFMLQPNDSQSSLGVDMGLDTSITAAARMAYEERCRVSPVARLPAELLISIFARLGASSDLMSCMLVSKEWARNSVGLLWHRPAMNKWECIQSVVRSIRKADKFFAYQDLVKRLNMSTLATQVGYGCLMGMADCKRVERLTLTNCTKLTDTSLQPLVDGNRSLLALDITGLDQVTDQTMITVADHCLRLQGLNVTGCKKLTDASIQALARSCRHVKRLKFNGCSQITDTAILTVAAYSTHLLEIDLHALHNIESPAITALLTSCPHLREVRLAHCTRVNDRAFLDVPWIPESPIIFDSLRILDLTDCNELGDKGVERIIETCPRLRNLILAKCRLITDRAVLAITKLGKNLHYIHLGHCQRITDLSVEALAKACNRIRYIDLACCSNLTDTSVTKLAGLPKLKRIGLVKCAGITDRSIYALAMGEMKGGKRMHGASVLERVHLSYCTLLTLDGIHVLLNNCLKLTHLSLTGVQAFLRDDLLSFIREAPSEFNNHQRDVFCVFSGGGVSRLREYLNQEKALALASGDSDSVTPSMAGGDDDMGLDGEMDGDGTGDSDGSNTPVISLDVHGSHPPGGTPILHGPGQGSSSGLLFANQHNPGGGWQNLHYNHGNGHGHGHDHDGAGSSSTARLSQSAPSSTTTAFGPHMWTGNGTGSPLSAGHQQHHHPPFIPPLHQQMQQQLQHNHGQQGGAQHVTGMMSAAVLDDVDEGDEAFGEGSEILGD